MKWPSKTLQMLPYFWSVLLDYFIKHNPLICEEWKSNRFYHLLLFFSEKNISTIRSNMTSMSGNIQKQIPYKSLKVETQENIPGIRKINFENSKNSVSINQGITALFKKKNVL